jgi:hypothetical protein
MDFEDDWRLLRPGTFKVYRGCREAEGCIVEVLEKGHKLNRTYPLDPRNDLVNHSPTGFECGEGQLERVQETYQHFKFAVIAGLGSEWELPQNQIQQILDGL